MLSSSIASLSRYALTTKSGSSRAVKTKKASVIQQKKSLAQRYSTAAPNAKGPIGEIDAIMNKFELQQKTIVEQAEVQVSYCRCWLSATFPRCDGSHKAHNMATGTRFDLLESILSNYRVILT